jgi:hypothetical protein
MTNNLVFFLHLLLNYFLFFFFFLNDFCQKYHSANLKQVEQGDICPLQFGQSQWYLMLWFKETR